MNNQNEILTKIIFLGGLEEVGKNCTVLEHDDEIWMIDCGIKFPSENIGYTKIIPDFDYIIKNKDRFKGLIITHGHEDHIGAILVLIHLIDIPVIYAPIFATKIIEKKIRFSRVNYNNLKYITNDSIIKSKHFTFSFYETVHSIPDTLGVITSTTNGNIIFTADFRIDFKPLGKKTEFSKISSFYNNQKCDLLLSDSTNSLVEGYNISESEVLHNLESLFKNSNKRIICSTFASNINRIKAIVEIAIKHERKIVLIGKSMISSIETAIKNNYIDTKNINIKNILISDNKQHNFPQSQILILCTGSQGEQMSALDRISNSIHPHIKITRNDKVIFTSRPIPGNYLQVKLIVNKLAALNAEVIESSSNFPIHTSGHATKYEQQMFTSLINPKYFIPIHGEYDMMREHIKTVVNIGVKKNNTFLCKNGDIIYLLNNKCYRGNDIKVKNVYFNNDNFSIIDNKNINLCKKLSNDGFVAINILLNEKQNKLLANPIILTRGSFYGKNNISIFIKLQNKIVSFLKTSFETHSYNVDIEEKIKIKVFQLIYKMKNLSPYIYISKTISK